MRTKIVYTVVGGEKGIYVPQALVAIYSARKYNPSANITLVIDKDTSLVIDKHLPNIKKYLSDLVVVHVPEELSNKYRSRFLKTKLREVIVGDFLYVDTDTIVAERLDAIDDIQADVAAALDRHSVLSENPCFDLITKDIKKVGLTIDDIRKKYFNSGVMYVKDTPLTHQLYKKWHENWHEARTRVNGIDQPPLALANKQCGYPIVELDGEWNCQLGDNFINYLSKAKILHYFASNSKSSYRLYDKSVFEEVWQCGDVPRWLVEELDKPKKFFCSHHTIAYGVDIQYLRTYVHSIYVYHKLTFSMFEFISKCISIKQLFRR